MADAPDLRRKTLEGFQWNGIGFVQYYATTLLGTALLSRLLLPEQFGLLGLLTVLVTISSFLVSLGLDFAVIQNRDLDSTDYSSFFWTNLLLGFAFSGAFFFCAPLIAEFYHQPDLKEPAQWYSLVFLIQAVGVVPQAIHGKALDFKERAIAQGCASVVSFGVAIWMALESMGIWCLVAQVLIFNLIQSSLNLLLLDWRPSLVISKASFIKVRSFGFYFIIFQLLDVVALNLDSLLVGKYLGARDLAFFGRAIALVMMPVTGLSLIFTKTFYSFFSAIQDNASNLKKEFVRAGELIVTIAAPVLLWLAVFPEEIVTILFGAQWVPMADLVSILAIPSILICFFGLTESFIIATGNIKSLSRASVIEKSVYLVMVLIGLRFGLMGLAYAKLGAIVLAGCIKFYLLRSSIQLNVLEWFYSLRKSLVALAGFLLICLLTKLWLQNQNEWVKLLIAFPASALAYCTILYLVRSEILIRVVQFIRERSRLL